MNFQTKASGEGYHAPRREKFYQMEGGTSITGFPMRGEAKGKFPSLVYNHRGVYEILNSRPDQGRRGDFIPIPL